MNQSMQIQVQNRHSQHRMDNDVCWTSLPCLIWYRINTTLKNKFKFTSLVVALCASQKMRYYGEGRIELCAGAWGGFCACCVSHGWGHLGAGKPVVWREPREMQPPVLSHSKTCFFCRLPLANHSQLSEVHNLYVSGGSWLQKDFWVAVYMVMGLGNCRLNSCSVTEAPWSSCHIQNILFSSLQRSGRIYEVFRLAHVYILINSAGNFRNCHC